MSGDRQELLGRVIVRESFKYLKLSSASSKGTEFAAGHYSSHAEHVAVVEREAH